MSRFVAIPDERTLLYSPTAFRLVDGFTLGQPLGAVSPVLQEEVAPGSWRNVNATPARTADGVYSYPGLGRTARTGRRPLNHRVVIDSDYYERHVPLEDGEFLVHPYNDQRALDKGEFAQRVQQIFMTPNSRFPFGSQIPLLRGRLTLKTQAAPPVVGAELYHQGQKALTDRNGDFVLPVLIPAAGTRTTEASGINTIKVENARGYFQARLRIQGAEASTYRVVDISWSNLLAATDHEAELVLLPEVGDDLPAGLPTGTQVSVLTFALRVEPRPGQEQIVDVSPENGFQKLLRVEVAPLS